MYEYENYKQPNFLTTIIPEEPKKFEESLATIIRLKPNGA